MPTVADGVHRIAQAYMNCYLVEDEEGLPLWIPASCQVETTLGSSLRDLGHPLGVSGQQS